MRRPRAVLRPNSLALLLTLGLVLSVAQVRATEQARPLTVEFLDVGQGDAALVISPQGKTMLVDAGPLAAASTVIEHVRRRTRGPLDLILLTHCHVDHLGAMASVMKAVGARMFLVGPCPGESDAYHHLLQTVQRLKISLLNAAPGRKLDLGGGAVMELLGPPSPPLSKTRSDANANSVVGRLQLGRTALLFMGDAERPTEKWLLASPATLRADLLKVAHHGSKYTTSAAFLKAVRPRIAVISVGASNEYGHPAAETLSRLQRAGIEVYRTDLRGTVTVLSDGERLQVHADVKAPRAAAAAGGKP